MFQNFQSLSNFGLGQLYPQWQHSENVLQSTAQSFKLRSTRRKFHRIQHHTHTSGFRPLLQDFTVTKAVFEIFCCCFSHKVLHWPTISDTHANSHKRLVPRTTGRCTIELVPILVLSFTLASLKSQQTLCGNETSDWFLLRNYFRK